MFQNAGFRVHLWGGIEDVACASEYVLEMRQSN